MWFKRRPVDALAQGAEAPHEEEIRTQRPKLSWLEKRDVRRRRRKTFEEVLGWILVPAFIYLIYLGVKSVGGIPKELIDFGNELIGIVMKGGR